MLILYSWKLQSITNSQLRAYNASNTTAIKPCNYQLLGLNYIDLFLHCILCKAWNMYLHNSHRHEDLQIEE